MSDVDWRELKTRFAEAESLRGDERDAYLADIEKADPTLHAELVSLLAYADEPDEVADPLPTLARYDLIERIGRGGMGSVYRARRSDGEYDQEVAVKVLRRGLDVEDLLRRFQAERQILARLDHPNISRLIDGGSTDDGRPYFVLEYVDGKPIDAFCTDEGLDLRARLRLFRQVCRAVGHAHRNLVVHRDIKPANILVTRDGVPKLLDFGIAKLLDDEQPGLTRTAMRPMTPSHASPEQMRGEAITTASDVYSLGVLLYELLTGESPYKRASGARSLEQQILETRAPRPSELMRATAATTTSIGGMSVAQVRRRLRGDLDTIVTTALRKSPERRYASVALLAADVDAWLAGRPISAHPDSVAYLLGKFLRRHWLGAATTALVLVTVAGLVTAYSLRLEEERNVARVEAAKARQLADFMQELFRATSPAASGVDVKVVDLLGDARLRLDDAVDLDPEVRDAIRLSLGEAYTGLGRIAEGREQIEAVMASEHARFGDDFEGNPETLYALARLHWQEAAYDDGVEVARRVVGIVESRSPPDPVAIADAWTEYADALIFSGQLDEAEEAVRRALSLRDGLSGQQAAIGNDYSHLGRILDRLGRYDEGLEINAQALAILEAEVGRDHPDTQNALMSRSSMLTNAERYEESLEVLEEAHAVMQRRAGPDHLRTAQVAAMLASVQTRLGRFDEAERLLLECLDIHLAQLPPDHYVIGYDHYYLSELYTQTGRLQEAEDRAKQSLAITLAAMGPDHGDTAYDYTNLATIQRKLGRPGDARSSYEAALDILARAYGDGHVRTQGVLTALVDLCGEAGETQCASDYGDRLAPGD